MASVVCRIVWCFSSQSSEKVSLCVGVFPSVVGGSGGRLGPRASPLDGGFSATILVISRLGPAGMGCT